MLNAPVQLVRDLCLAPLYAAEIDADALHRDAVILALPHLLIDFGAAKERLAGHAAPVQAGSPHLVLLDDGDLHTQLRRANRSDITPRTRSQNHQIVLFSHGFPRLPSHNPPADVP